MIIVIGGSGYVGSHLVHRLACSADILIIDRKPPAFPLPDNVSFHTADVSDDDISSLLSPEDIVMHLAAEPDVRKPDAAMRDTYDTTRTLVSAMTEAGSDRMIMFSSSAVYGMNAWRATEDSLCEPVSEYGRAKLMSEKEILSNIANPTILRFSNICGGNVTHGVVHDFYTRLGSDPSVLEILGNGKQTREYLHVDDAVSAAIHVLDNGLMGVYNVGNGDPISVLDVADAVISEMGLVGTEVLVQDSDTGWPGDVPRCLLDNSRIKATEWNPTHGSLDAVRDSVHHMMGDDVDA